MSELPAEAPGFCQVQINGQVGQAPFVLNADGSLDAVIRVAGGVLKVHWPDKLPCELTISEDGESSVRYFDVDWMRARAGKGPGEMVKPFEGLPAKDDPGSPLYAPSFAGFDLPHLGGYREYTA